tara:strand:+ start:162 stop:287 length:126 start_codon:yes stop_codon:yes gene_type:complete
LPPAYQKALFLYREASQFEAHNLNLFPLQKFLNQFLVGQQL